MKGQQKTALSNVCMTVFRKCDAQTRKDMMRILGQGLGRAALAKYQAIVKDLAAKGGKTGAIRDMVAGADFMPLVLGTVSHRYSCRRSACRLIPLREAYWVIAKAAQGGRREMWLCP